MTHTFSEVSEPDPSGDANLTELVPTCSCGWRGFGIASYNDDLFVRLRKQELRHMREVAPSGDNGGSR